jgi:MFS family permease
MPLDPYRRVLARPGVRSLLIVTLLARIPITAAPVVLTLHVVLGLGLGFTQTGLVAAVVALGAAVGSPLVGRAIDAVGLRPVLITTTVAEGAFWFSARWLPYHWLVLTALLGGMLALPVFSVARQSLAALLPPAERQPGFSLDSMSVEVSFAFGPALGVVILTQAGSTVAFLSAATLIVISGLALTALDPAVHGAEGVAADLRRDRPRVVPDRAAAPPLRSWFSHRVAAVMLATFGATFTLAGTDTAITAVMRAFDRISLLGVVIAVWCVASLIGGFGYGLLHRSVDPLVLLAFLAALTIPVAFAGSWWLLALFVIPAGVFCAPLISATAEVLSRVTPAEVRGQVMGLHSSALTIGNAAGASLVGVVVDRVSPRSGFVGIGVLGLLLALLGLLAQARRGRVRERDDVLTAA